MAEIIWVTFIPVINPYPIAAMRSTKKGWILKRTMPITMRTIEISNPIRKIIITRLTIHHENKQ